MAFFGDIWRSLRFTVWLKGKTFNRTRTIWYSEPNPYQETWVNFENKNYCLLAKNCPYMAFFRQWRQHLGNETGLPKVRYLHTSRKWAEGKLYPGECIVGPFRLKAIAALGWPIGIVFGKWIKWNEISERKKTVLSNRKLKQRRVLSESITSEMRKKEKGWINRKFK